jgi:hypothetical protein
MKTASDRGTWPAPTKKLVIFGDTLKGPLFNRHLEVSIEGIQGKDPYRKKLIIIAWRCFEGLRPKMRSISLIF